MIEWFNNIENKENCAFIQLDIKDFYLSITEKILDNAIEFTKEYTTIIDDNIRIIKHCRKSLLFEKDATWVKKGTACKFDVTMGSYDRAQVCELVRIYILSTLAKRIDKKSTGLYRDDGLIILRKCDGPTGHTANLEFNPNMPKEGNGKRNIIWFNPPFNKNVKTNIGKTFLKLVDKHFPRSSNLHKIFNRNTIKVSYSCTENMSMIIKKHNKKIINAKIRPTILTCNCQKKTECPLNGNFLQPSVIYMQQLR